MGEGIVWPAWRHAESRRNDVTRASGNNGDDASTFEIGTFCHYAPGWNGIISGIQGVGIGVKPPSYSDA